jgi:hypothetical protein
MAKLVGGRGWAVMLPERAQGGPVAHTHTHLDSMSTYRAIAIDRTELVVIVTTFPGLPVLEDGSPFPLAGRPWQVPGARSAVRWEQITRLDDNLFVDPVRSVIVVAETHGGSVCLVVHRPLEASPEGTEIIVRSFQVTNPNALTPGGRP